MSLKLMTSLFTILFLTLAFNAQVKAGATSGNGPGGEVSVGEWITFGGLGEMIQKGHGYEYDEQVENFRAEYPNVTMVKCVAKSGVKAHSFPVLPAQYAHIIDLQYKQSKPFGKSQLAPLDYKTICGNLRLIQAVGTFSFFMHDIAKSDSITDYIIKKLSRINFGGKIAVVISPKQLKMKYNGGTLLEYGQYDSTLKTLVWATPSQCEGFLCLLKRKETNIIRHELMHMLVHKALGDRYPKEKVWHDIRFDAEDGWSPEWTKAKTSVDAAYIEGISNAIERRSLSNNPWVIDRGNINSLRLNEKTGELCYWNPEEMVVRNKKLVSLQDNEFLVSSALNMLFESHQMDPYKEGQRLADDLSFYVFHNEDRMKIFIDAIADYAPANLRELAFIFDHKTNTDMGLRMLREFFYIDYFNKSTLHEFHIATHWENQKTLCTSASNADQFLTPLLEAEEKQSRDSFEAEVAKAFPPAEVLKQLDSKIEYSKASFDKLGGESGIQAAELLKFKYASSASKMEEKTEYKAVEAIYQMIITQSNSQQLASEAAISEVINDGVNNKKSEVLSKYQEAQSEAVLLRAQILNATKQLSEPLSADLLKQTIAITKRLDEVVQRVREFESICNAMKAVVNP